MDFAALQHSVFLQALGGAILNSIWQCLILWLIYETITIANKSATARFKNNLGTLLLFSSFAWFLGSLVFKVFEDQNAVAGSTTVAAIAVEAHPGVHAVSGFGIFLSYASKSLPYLSVAYIFLLLFLTSRLLAAYRYVYLISNKRLIRPGVELKLFATKVALEIGIRKKISVWISQHIDVPATVGFIKPVILIPLASINNLSSLQLEAIILHELAHIRRNDYITNLVISVIETILFFNPFVVLLSNAIKRERENCCDDFVLQYRYDPHSYASALLRLEQSRMSKLKLAIGAVSGKKQLLSRIKRITNRQVVARQFNYGQKLMALLLVTGIICSVAWLSPNEKKSVAVNSAPKVAGQVTQLKISQKDKVQRTVEVVVAGKKIDNLPLLSMKHFSAKAEPPIPPDPIVENAPEDMPPEIQDEKQDEKSNDADLFKIDNNDNANPKVDNHQKQTFVFLDKNHVKLPSFNFQNLSLGNLNFKIDLGTLNIENINENLKKAYRQINTVDWKKVQDDFKKNFPQLKLEKLAGDIDKLTKERNALHLEKAAALSKFDLIQAQQNRYNLRTARELLKKEISRQDSMRNAEMTVWNEAQGKVQQEFKKIQRQYATTAGSGNNSNYYYSYSINKTDDTDKGEETKEECAEKSRTYAINYSSKKGLRISIKRVPPHAHTGLLAEKKPLQFSFAGADGKSNSDNVISVEVNDEP